MNKSLFPPFNVDRQIKSFIGYSWKRDASEHLIRVNILCKELNNTSRSYISKIYVDILLSIECNLKSLIVTLSKKDESPEECFKQARKRNHRINELYQEVAKRAKGRVKILSKSFEKELLNNSIKIGISNRYRIRTLEQIISDGIPRYFGEGVYSNLMTEEYLDVIRTIADELNTITRKINSKYLDNRYIKGKNNTLFEKRLKKFFQNCKYKL